MTMPVFGDRVRVRDTVETRDVGIADRAGVVYGVSTPSVSGVGPVVGDRGDDFALSIHFEEMGKELWLAAHLVEFVDHNEGLTMTIGERSFVRDANGQFRATTDADDEQR